MEIIQFLKDLMRKRRRLPSQLAADLGVSHATMHRWLNGKDIPSTRSCRRLAEYSGVSVQKILAAAGHIAEIEDTRVAAWPEFREYAKLKYADVLDDDVITMIEDLIERRRQQKLQEQATRKNRTRKTKTAIKTRS